MVFCVEAEGFSPEMILTKAMPELERLRESCRATSSADQVTMECRMAQDRVREVLRQEISSSAGTMISAESRRRFVEHPALGPERVGLLRILHDLGDAGKADAGVDRVSRLVAPTAQRDDLQANVARGHGADPTGALG